MGRNKMIAKSCPKCHMQVAVASKACKCGHTFFLARRGADSLARRGGGGGGGEADAGGGGGGGGGDELRRRTARVRRSQTQFYDGQHYEKQKRRTPKKRSLSGSIDETYKSNKEKESATARARRRRALRRAQRGEPTSGEGGGERAVPLKPAQLARCHLILQEINRKMRSVTWQPPQDF